MKSRMLAIAFMLSTATNVAAADEWGNLKGRFVYDGDPPAAVAPAAPGRPMNESLVVDADSGGVANIVVWVRTKKIDVHPALAAPPAAQFDWQWRNSRIDPHVALLRVGQKLVMKNNDPAGHLASRYHPQCPSWRRACCVPRILARASFRNPKRCPSAWGACIRGERGWLVIRDNPDAAPTRAAGSFELSKLPATELEFQFWHERVGYLKAKPDWSKGRAEVEDRC